MRTVANEQVAGGDARGPDLRDRTNSVRRMRAIAFTPMSAKLRNALIIQAYGDIAEEMAELFGTDDATWVNLGVWASNEVGGYLDLPIPVLGGLIARHFGDGNRDIFADIGRAHAVFLRTVGDAHRNGGDLDRAWRRCQRRLAFQPVEPPGRPRGEGDRIWDSLSGEADPHRRNHNRALVRGFEAYCRALTEPDPIERSRLIFLGSVLLALHEQRHLSLPISLGFRFWLRSILRPGSPIMSTREWMNRDPGWSLRVENWWIRTATKRFIGIQLPDHKVHVRHDVPDGDDPVVFEPDPVAPPLPWFRYDSPQDILTKLWHELDVDGRPAKNWNALGDRVAYIAVLIQQYQRADEWWADRAAGTIVRPEPWDQFDQQLEQQIARTADAHVPPAASPNCPHDDAYLDELRTCRSEPELPDGELEFGRLHDPDARAELTAHVGADLAARYAVIGAPGGLFDPATCRQARKLFDEWQVLILMGLLFRSLPDAYAAADGVKVIGRASNLSTDAFRRVGETAHFLQELLLDDDGWDNGALVEGGEAWESLVGLRGLHAMVSKALTERNWRSDERGEPINQEDMLGTAMSFVVPVFEMLDELGAKIDDDDREAYLRFWLGVGHLLGAPIEAVTVADGSGRRPLTWDEAVGLSHAIRRRHHRRTLDGVRLTEALIDGVADGFPRPIRWIAPGFLQALGDPIVTSLLMARDGRGLRRASAAANSLRLGLKFPPTRALNRALIQFNGKRVLRPFLDEGTRRPYRKPYTPGMRTPIAAIDIEKWPLGWDDTTKKQSATPRRKQKRQLRGSRPSRPRTGSGRRQQRQRRRLRRR